MLKLKLLVPKNKQLFRP